MHRDFDDPLVLEPLEFTRSEQFTIRWGYLDDGITPAMHIAMQLAHATDPGRTLRLSFGGVTNLTLGGEIWANTGLGIPLVYDIRERNWAGNYEVTGGD